MENINWEEISLTIITHAGMAKSNAIIAISEAEAGNFTTAAELLASAEKDMITAEKTHMDIIVQEAQGVQHDFKVLFMHAEDQMLTTQVLIILAQKFVNLYQKLAK